MSLLDRFAPNRPTPFDRGYLSYRLGRGIARLARHSRFLRDLIAAADGRGEYLNY